MLFKRIGLGALIAVLQIGIASAQDASSSWNGTWGGPVNRIIVNGNNVQYVGGGKSFPVSGVQMTAQQLSFMAGQATVVVSHVNDHVVNMASTLAGQTVRVLLCRNPLPKATTCP